MDYKVPQDKFTVVNGVRTRYWEEGDKGTPVVLVHGLGGFVENWIYNIGPLSKKHRVYAFDLLGFGQTEKKPLVGNLFQLVAFIGDFLDTLQIKKAVLIGNSLGGGLALQYAIDNPDRVDKLVLVDNAGLGREVCSDFKFCALPFINRFFVKPNTDGVDRIMGLLVHDPSVMTKEFQDYSRRYSNLEGSLKSFLSTLMAGVSILGQKNKLVKPLLERLDTVRIPTLIIWGNEDRIIPVSHAHIAAKKIPGARLEIFENCGHIPQFEQREKFNRLVLEFLGENNSNGIKLNHEKAAAE